MADQPLIELTIDGLDTIINGLKSAPRIIHKELKKSMRDVLGHLVGEAKPYPPKPPRSRYRRTGTLGRTLYGKVDPSSREVIGRFGDRAEYAPQVIGEDQLSHFKQIGWISLPKRIRDNRRFMEKEFTNGLHRASAKIARGGR